MFPELEDAKNACKSSKGCQGVINGTSVDVQAYYLCPTNATTIYDKDVKTCMFEKIIIGKVLDRYSIHIDFQKRSDLF